MPKNLTARQRMDRKLRTKPGRALYRLCGQTVEPVFGQVKEHQGADRFMMRGIIVCIMYYVADLGCHRRCACAYAAPLIGEGR